MKLFVAVALSRADVVSQLVAADAGILAKQLGFVARVQPPLHLAVSRNLPDMAELLVDLGQPDKARASYQAAFDLYELERLTRLRAPSPCR